MTEDEAKVRLAESPLKKFQTPKPIKK